MMRILLLFTLLSTTLVYGQKKRLDHTVYNDWKHIENEQISNDGNYVVYEINPHRGDGYLYIHNVETGKTDSIHRGTQPQISGNSNYVAFKIDPGYDTLRTCELDEVDKKKWPKDSLGIWYFKNDSLTKYPRIQSFEVNDESDWMIIKSAGNKKPEAKKKKRLCKRKKNQEPAYSSKGKKVSVFNPITNERTDYNDVKAYQLSELGNQFAFYTHQQFEKKDSFQLYIHTIPTNELTPIESAYTAIGKFTFDRSGEALAYLYSNDTIEEKNYALKWVDTDNHKVQLIADSTVSFMGEGNAVSQFFAPSFSKKGDYLFFGVAEAIQPEPEDTLLESEKVELDIWHHADQRLQPQQLLELKRDEKKANMFIYRFQDGSATQLSSDTLRVRKPYDVRWDDQNGYLLGVSVEPYAHTYNWEIPYPEDHYLVSVKTGEATLIRKGDLFGGRVSPAANYYTYYDDATHNHYAIDLTTKEVSCLTCTIDNTNWEGDINGMPMKAYPLGIVGWKEGEDEVYIQSEFDIWSYTFSTKSVKSLTNEEGVQNDCELRMRRWSYDSVYVDFENTYIKGFNRETKAESIYTVHAHNDHTDLTELATYDAKIYYLFRSKDKSQKVLRKMTAAQYPELELIDDQMKQAVSISVTNPQQADYVWPTVERVKWKGYDGTELEGLLYKPDDFSATKEYPLMVYFYELYSDRYHNYSSPRPSASTINFSEYASAGYVVFVPDVRYKSGHPAQSAYDCIVSGTDHVLGLYSNIDSNRMALQGQSWGGYQTAQLITMTKRYRAAMAGAPVTNMFSAYGGIRWGSGLNRQFQYEHTQSRIGYTIWEKPELYVENSPQFHLPNVETPLLIMHNDGDGAVPWYQGIELFTGLKRLGKDVWMLNYNDEEHNLMQNANRVDLSIRMRQFFDHYLLNKPAPLWLSQGRPAIMKGKDLRYELDENK